jgi:hypothetical protein
MWVEPAGTKGLSRVEGGTEPSKAAAPRFFDASGERCCWQIVRRALRSARRACSCCRRWVFHLQYSRSLVRLSYCPVFPRSDGTTRLGFRSIPEPQAGVYIGWARLCAQTMVSIRATFARCATCQPKILTPRTRVSWTGSARVCIIVGGRWVVVCKRQGFYSSCGLRRRAATVVYSAHAGHTCRACA